MKKRTKYILSVVLAVILIMGAGASIYINDCYRADEAAMAAMNTTATVSVETDGQYTVFRLIEDSAGSADSPDAMNPRTGLIFYPGGKVEHTAYAPLLSELAENGVLCVLVEMPAKLAVLDSGAAEGVVERFPEVERWYIGGHSLGGSMAASYAAGAENLEGLILLASYSTVDLSETDLKVLSVYGSEDGVLNFENYGENRANLPENTAEIVIEGGNHAGFGSYGAQEGDGVAAIGVEEQRGLTVDHLTAFFGR